MKLARSWMFPFFLAAMPVALCAQPKIEIKKVADGVYAALQPAAQRFEDSNSTIILLDDGVVVVDTQESPATSRAIIAEIRKVTDKPVRYVVNTHWHGDHVQGNQAYREAFGPGVEFIAHRTTREDIEKRAISELKEQIGNLPQQIEQSEKQLAAGVGRDGKPLTDDQKQQLRGRIERYKLYLAWRRDVTEWVLPTAVFDDTLTLHRGGRTIQLMHFAGHTRGDVVVYLPGDKVLITGDLLDDLPYAGDGSPAALIKTLHSLEHLDFVTMIPGHGAVRQGKEHLGLIVSLFESLVAQVESAARAGLSLEDTLKKVDIDSFRDRVTGGDEVARRYWNFFMGEAVKRAYQEATTAQKN